MNKTKIIVVIIALAVMGTILTDAPKAYAKEFARTPNQITVEQKIKLDQFVKEGKINSFQETAIIGELALIRAKYSPELLRSLTPKERKAKITEMRNEIISWAKFNNIDSVYLNSTE